ncbi:MAG TPA: peptidoglycan-binding protein [Acidimicrobiales bacterium]
MADILEQGDTGLEVKALQEDITERGYERGTPDGIFGPATEAVVRMAQRENGIAEDGIVGPETRAALAQQSQDERLLEPGAENDAVRQVQEILSSYDFAVGPVDGIFGARTEAAVKVLQKTHGLVVDGIVGPKTWRALKSL